MAEFILVLGHPGTGKTSSLRNLKKDEASIISVTGKRFPFKTDLQQAVARTPQEVLALVEKASKPIVIIDDFNYLITFEAFDRKDESDQWAVYKDIGQHIYAILTAIIQKPDSQIFYLLAHIEENEEGRVLMKTLGKAVRNNIVPDGLTNMVIQSECDLGEFIFKVKAVGNGIKTPPDMFKEATLPNDIKLVDKAIREYYK